VDLSTYVAVLVMLLALAGMLYAAYMQVDMARSAGARLAKDLNRQMLAVKSSVVVPASNVIVVELYKISSVAGAPLVRIDASLILANGSTYNYTVVKRGLPGAFMPQYIILTPATIGVNYTGVASVEARVSIDGGRTWTIIPAARDTLFTASLVLISGSATIATATQTNLTISIGDVRPVVACGDASGYTVKINNESIAIVYPGSASLNVNMLINETGNTTIVECSGPAGTAKWMFIGYLIEPPEHPWFELYTIAPVELPTILAGNATVKIVSLSGSLDPCNAIPDVPGTACYPPLYTFFPPGFAGEAAKMPAWPSVYIDLGYNTLNARLTGFLLVSNDTALTVLGEVPPVAMLYRLVP